MSGKYAGNLPYGYEKGEPNIDGQVNILQVSHEIEIVKGIYDALLNQEYKSMQELCNDLNKNIKQKIKRIGINPKLLASWKILLIMACSDELW